MADQITAPKSNMNQSSMALRGGTVVEGSEIKS